MKKNLLLICLAASSLIVSSCTREDLPQKDQPIIERTTINVELKKNEAYHYTVPQNLSDDPYQLTQQAAHASLSELDATDYYYTPALNYVGTDQVVIANVEEQHNGNQHGCSGGSNSNNNCSTNNHGCNGGNHHDAETERIITINFIIKETAVGKLHRFIGTPAF